jgi:hypothetical protein
MSLSQWFRFLLTRKHKTTPSLKVRSAGSRRYYCRSRLERLEDRLAPATNIAIVSGAAGAGNLDHFLSATQGTITSATDPGDTAATLSTGALAGVGAAVNISIAATGLITFNNLGGTLALQTAMGHSAAFSTTNGTITFNQITNTLSTGGGALTFSAGTNLMVGNLNSNGGEVSLSAGTNGAGNLQFENILTNGSGNLTLLATNAAGGTISQTTGTAAGQAITATATGGIAVNALRGTTVNLTSSTGAVVSSGSQNVQVSAQLSVTAVTGINLNTLAASFQATNTTSGDINVVQAASPAQTLDIAGIGVVNHAAAGMITLIDGGASIAVGSNGVVSNNGVVTLSATDLQITAPVNSGTARTILENSTIGRAIDLGTNTSGTLGLAQSELNEVTAGILQVGSANAGTVNVSAAITTPTGGPGSWNVLTLENGSAITEAAAGALTVPDLRISSGGPVILDSANDVGVLAANITNSITFNDGTHLLIVGMVDNDTGILTTNSAITLIADSVSIQQQINAGTGVVNFLPFTATTVITVGSGVTGLGISNAELGFITAGEVTIGESNAGNPVLGTITVDGAITRHAGFNTLSLETASSAANAIIQVAPISVARLNVETGGGNVTLSVANDVDALSANVTNVGAPATEVFTFANNKGLVLDQVDGGFGGIQTDTGIGSRVTLTAGGAVTQNAGVDIRTDNLQLLGAGPYTLTDPGNDVSTLAADVTGAVRFTDDRALTVGTVNGTNGVNTMGSAVAITAGAGPGATGLTVSQAINTNTPSSITLTADRMSLGAAVNSLFGAVVLKPITAGRPIDLGTNSNTADLGLLPSDVNNVTGAALFVGSAAAGDLTVTAPITPLGTIQLELVTGGGIFNSAASNLITVGGIAFEAVNGIGDVGSDMVISANQLDAVNTGNHSIFIDNVGTVLSIGGVDPNLHGVRITGTSGTIFLSNDNSIQIILNGDIVKGPGDVAIRAVGATANVLTGGQNSEQFGSIVSTDPNGTVTVLASQDLVLGLTSANANGDIFSFGKIVLAAGRDILDDSKTFIEAKGVGTAGTISATAGRDISILHSNGIEDAHFSTAGGTVSMTTGGNSTFTADSDTVPFGNGDASVFTNDTPVGSNTPAAGGNIVIDADHVDIGVGDLLRAGIGSVTIQQVTGTELIELGPVTDAELDLSNGELGRILANTLRIGNPINAGSIFITANVTVPATNVSTVSLRTGGNISDAGGDILAANNLALTAGTGIGSPASRIITSVTGLDYSNGAGFVEISNTGGNDEVQQVTVAGSSGTFTLSFNGATTASLPIGVTAAQLQDALNNLLTIRNVGGVVNVIKNGNIYKVVFGGSLSDVNVPLMTATPSGGVSTAVFPLQDGAPPGPLTITDVDGLGGAVNNGTNTLLLADGPITFLVNTFSGGTLTVATTETAGETTTPLPRPDDDITVDTSVDIVSTGGNVELIAADSIVTRAFSLVKSDAGTINFKVGMGDNDADGVLNIGGALSGTFSFTSTGDINVDQLFPNGLNDAGHSVTLTSTGGAILDGDTAETEPASPTGDFTNGASVDITADTLQLTAFTGIGVKIDGGVGPLETQVTNLGADTDHGGIFITNGVASAVTLNVKGTDGVQVTGGTTGDIQLTNQGTIDSLTDNDTVRGPGNVFVQAFGSTADVNTGGQSGDTSIRGLDSGGVTVEAGRDINAGDNTGLGSIHSASGSVVLMAGRNINVNANAEVTVVGGIGTLTVTAGGDIIMSTVGNRAGAPLFAAASGDITLTTGAGHTFIADSTGTDAVTTSGGTIDISTDNLVLNKGITTGGIIGVVNIRQATGGPGSTKRNIDLGLGTTAGDLDISDTELAQITTGGLLRIGRFDNAGDITITGPVTTHAGFSTLKLGTAGTVVESGTGAITVTNLAVQANGGASLNTNASTVSNIAANIGAVGIEFLDSSNLNVSTVDGIVGIGNQGVLLESSTLRTLLTVNQAVTSIFTGIDFQFDNIVLNAAVMATAPATAVRLEPFNQLQLIDLGGNNSPTALGVPDAELTNITAPVLQIGNTTDIGNIQVTANITTHAGFNTMLLANGGVISDPSSTVAVRNLALQAGNGIGTAANPLLINSSTLAASNNFFGEIDITDVSPTGLTINGSPIAGVTNVNNNALNNNVVIATQEQATPGQDLNLTNNAIVQADGGKVTLRAGDNLSIASTALVKTNFAGTLELDVDFDPTNVDSASGTGGTLNVHGASLAGASATLVGGPNNDIFNINSLGGVPITIVGGGSAASSTQTTSVVIGSTKISRTVPIGDKVNIDDTGSTTATFYSVAKNALQSKNHALISFSNIQTVNLTTTKANDTVSVVGSPAALSSITSKLGNSVLVSSTAANSVTMLNGSTAGVTYTISGTGMGSVLVARGGAMGNSFDVTGTGANSGVELDGNTANDQFFIAASGNSSLLSLHGNGGNDLFDIGTNGVLDTIHGKVAVAGGTGNSTLYVNDQNKNASGLNYVVTASTITRLDLAGFLLSFSQVQDLQVLGAMSTGGVNTMYLTGAATGVNLGLYGNGGNYAFSVMVSSTSGYSNVLVDGRSGTNNELFVTDVSGGAVNHNSANSDGTSGGVFTTYPGVSGARASEVIYDNVENVFPNPNNA